MGWIRKTFGLEALSETPGEPEGDYSANVTPPARSGHSLTLNDALGLPAVFRSIQIIAGLGSQLLLESWRGTERVTPTPKLLEQPDPWRSLSSFLERCLIDLATDGNAFLLKSYGPDRQVAAVQALDPFQTRVRRHPRTGAKEYVTYDPATRRTHTYTADRIEHVWALEVPGHDRGLAPIAANRLALAGQLDTRDYAGEWFGTTDVPSGVLSSDQQLDPASVAMYRRVWHNPGAYDDDDTTNLVRRGPSVRVLGKGLTYTPIMLKPEDAQWIESRKFGLLEVALMWGMPANYLHASIEGSSLTYQSLEMIDTQFLKLTLYPAYLRKLEAAFTNLLPRGQTSRFDPSAFLRPDAKTRAEVDKTYIDAGVYDAAYVRTRDRIELPAGSDPQPSTPAPTPATEEAPA